MLQQMLDLRSMPAQPRLRNGQSVQIPSASSPAISESLAN